MDQPSGLIQDHHTKNSSVQDSDLKKSPNGITLVPQPSEDPRDPLNWPASKKAITAAIWSLGAFSGTASGLGNTLGYFIQAKLYGKEPIQIAYSVVVATAGIALGPLVFVPLGQKYGRSTIFIWSILGLLVTGIWSATMTKPDQYGPFLAARLIGGLFGGNFVALGADVLVDIYFLHQRGKAFTALNLSFLLGVVIGPTFSGFIVQSASWPVQFWWTNGLEGAIVILAVLFLEDTYYDRSSAKEKENSGTQEGQLVKRIRTLLGGSHSLPETSFFHLFVDQFIIGLSPVTLLIGGFTLIDFGFAAFVNIILTVFLQDPISQGGYAFTPIRNAEFLFCLWFGVIGAQVYGHLVSDRLPLWVCRRRGGVWEPEYRLHALWLPGFIVLPIGLGLFGASLMYHLHFMVLAVSSFLIGWATTAIIPISVNYAIECFHGHASAAGAIMGLYRLAFSLTLPFFVPAWMAKVGAGWCLGMAAFFSIFAYLFIIVLIWKGHTIRQWSFARVASSEEGMKIIGEKAPRTA